METLKELIIPIDEDYLKRCQRIHPLLNELGAETVVWAIRECLKRESSGQESSPLKPSDPIPEEHVVRLLKSTQEFPPEEQAVRLANIISAILGGDEHFQVYRPVFMDYFRANRRKYFPDDEG